MKQLRLAWKPGRFLYPRLLVLPIFLIARTVIGQVQITGTVYDESQRYTMAGVSVMGTSGAGTMTDIQGHYSIRLSSKDSLYFSYLGKFTPKYPVAEIAAGQPFDMSLEVSVDSLPAVYVRMRNYLLDSLENRKEYQKVFDYQSRSITNFKMEHRPGLGVGLDMDMLFFHANANRRMEAFQKRLEEDERDRYVDHRFTRALAKKITGLEPPALDSFMREYRPSYEFVQSCATDYEFYHFIQVWGGYFRENHALDAPAKDSVRASGSPLPF